MTNLDDVLGIEDTPEQRRANALVENDMRLLRALIELRETKGVSQEELARRLGVTQPAIAAFERYDNDPKLSTIRRYAHGIGALVDHSVVPDDGSQIETSNRSDVTVEITDGMLARLLISPSSLNSSTTWSEDHRGGFHRSTAATVRVHQ